ncbi:Metallophosphoesterase MPPED2 (Metallophosphoesterase domain-containing protein 2) [Durusdinium trenchii]|uniref:Metallophosphoesterase MPPED2 (Metallophosphoesterase domain-containing protein 2) n=1 Tax=Durusdinium trenchii TaxID=1381693 RepID=A0ABP0JVT5_9DINO
MLGWLYDVAWSSILSLRQGPVQTLGAQENGFLYMRGTSERLLANSPIQAEDLPLKPKGHVRLVLVSDTHERHRGLRLPPCDAVLHSGDVLACSSYATRQHAEQVLKDFGDWLRSAECARRFVIAGNHDFWLEELGPETTQELLGDAVQYLEFSSGSFTVDLGAGPQELRVFGAPLSAGKSFNRAFQQKEARQRFLAEPEIVRAEIVLTHGPLSSSMWTEEMVKRLSDLRPALHVCGHIHGYYGRARPITTSGGLSINASTMQTVGRFTGQRPWNPPIVLDLQLSAGAEPVGVAPTCAP